MLRKMPEKVIREDLLYRGFSVEARKANTRGGSDVYLTSSEGHHNVDE